MSPSIPTAAGNLASAFDCLTLRAEYYETRWYAAYTNANHEKRVAEQLAQKSIEHFLPLYASARRWKDRTVNLQMPLFPGYVFLQLALRDRLQVLQVPGVVRLVGFGGTPAELPAEEVESLRRAQAGGMHLEPHPFLSVGRRVRITAGPLAGRVGILKRWKGRLRVLLSVELIQRSVLVDIDVLAIEPVASGKFRNEIVSPRP